MATRKRAGLPITAPSKTRVIRPALAGQIPPARASTRIASARTAALVDPEGEGLAKCLAEIDAPAMRIAAE